LGSQSYHRWHMGASGHRKSEVNGNPPWKSHFNKNASQKF
jgi:hypothetical protein